MPDIGIEMPIDDSKCKNKRPWPIYVLSIMYLWSGFKGFFAGLFGPSILWLCSGDEVKKELAKQPNFQKILESTKLLEQFTNYDYLFLAVGGFIQILAAFYLFKMRKRALTAIIIGLIINILSFLYHGPIKGWSVALGKHGIFGFLFDWAFSLLIVYYLWLLVKDERLKST